jgi:peptidoglycan/LPS O-acetylase OafA/YrhL
MHLNQFASKLHISPLIKENGAQGLAVTIFFVLSGYLITYLLLLEKEKFGTVDLKMFYVRRILRIWPLYFFVLLATLVVSYLSPDATSLNPLGYGLLLFIFFLPNWAIAKGITITPITPLWSIGVEEQFYIVWPLLMKKCKSLVSVRNTIIGFFVIYLVIKLALRFLENGFYYSFVALTRLDCMAMGGLGAYWVKSNASFIKTIFYTKIVQAIAWIVLVVSLVYKPIHIFDFIDHELFAVVALVIIVNVSSNTKTIIGLENRFFDFMGKISYGLYMYHMLIITTLSLLFAKLTIQNSVFNASCIYFLVIALTIGIAALSYFAFELKFIQAKKKFSKIQSHNSRS